MRNKIMINFPFFSLLITLFLFSCLQQVSKSSRNKVEIIKLGAPQYLDTNNISKIGGVIYALYEEGNDSILLKSTFMKELFEDGLYPSDSLTATYYYCLAGDSIKERLNYFINYLKPLRDGRFPGNYRSLDRVGCNLLGTWLAILTDSLGKRHYYNFSAGNLPQPIRATSELIYELGAPYSYKKAINHTHINTDSIVSAILQLSSMDSIELVRSRRIHLRFTPPDVVPE